MMDDDKGETGMADQALNLAKGAVNSATAQMDEVDRRLTDTVKKARRPVP